jgi:hypothetical protein
MRLRAMLLVMVMVCVAALPALANKEMAKSAPSPMNSSNTVYARDIFEGFEGSWPPAGWTTFSNSGHVPGETWYQGDNLIGTPFEGNFMATCEWDPDLIFQDNILSFNHTVNALESHLNFQISGSQYWSANYDCTVEVDGVVVYSWAANVLADWTYQLVDIDLSAYLGQTIEIAFRYTGLDGAAIYLDAVGLNEGYEPPPPPEPPLNDTCEGAWDNNFEILPGAFSYDTDNTDANADYALVYPSCTGYSVSGQDVVWYVCLNEGEVLDVSMQCGFDASLFIVTDCADPQNTCVAGADATVSEGLEEIIGFTAPADGMYYVIVSAYGSGTGPINVYGTNYGGGCVIATEETSFGGIKSIYR